MLKYLLIAIEVIVGLLLIGVVLLQRSKDQGLGLAFGAGMGESLFGSQAVNVLVKITVVLACVFFLNTMILARMMRSQASVTHMVPKQGLPGTGSAPRQEVPAGTAQPAQGGATEMPAPANQFTPAAAASGSEPAGAIPASAATVPIAP